MLFRASYPALISAGYGILYIKQRLMVGWVERSEARHRVSPKAGCFFRASYPALISAGYGILYIKQRLTVGWVD
ncbi:Uncharacterised protein [Legionella geestiana]|nr:Uncharacterised protein [Legionella geestiana]